MSHELVRQMDEISERMFELHDVFHFKELEAKISSLSTQLTVQRGFHEISSLIRDERPLPVRRIGYNIKALSGAQSDCKWLKLQNLDFTPLIFCTLSFQGLIRLPNEQFNWLVENVTRYLRAQALPLSWISTDQIRKVLANTARPENTTKFWEKYHKLELETCKVRGSYDLEGQSNIWSQKSPRERSPMLSRVPDHTHVQETGRNSIERKRRLPEEIANNEPGQTETAKHPRLGLRYIPDNPSWPEDESYFSFYFVKRDKIESLPEPFRTWTKMSSSWKKEVDRGGLPITNCLSLRMPKTGNKDVFFQIKLGYNEGWNIFHLFDFGGLVIPCDAEVNSIHS